MQTENTQQDVGFRLSPQQEQLWLLRPDDPGFRTQCAVLIRGEVESDRVRTALAAVIGRHEILRTTFRRQTGLRVPTQIVHETVEPSWAAEERSDDELVRNDEVLDALLAAEAAEPLDLEAGPLVRALLVLLPGEQYVLVLTAAAVCADATSLVAVVREVVDGLADGGPGVAEPLQYADFAEWRNEIVADEEDAEAVAGRAWWGEQDLSSLGSPALLFAAGVPTGGTPVPASVRLDLSAVAPAVEPALFFEACWHALASRLSGEGEIGLAAVVDARSHEELAGAVGTFAQTLPIRARIGEETSLAEVLDQIRRSRAELERWQDYATLDDLHAIASSLGLAYSAVEADLGARASVLALRGHLDGAALRLSLVEADRRLAELHYDAASYRREDVEAVGRYLATLAASAALNSAATVASLRLLDEAEQRRLVVALNDTAAPIPDACVHHLFEEQARRTPERAAVASETASLSYAELNAKANRIAHWLRGQSVGRDTAVGLCMDRSVDMIAALLGILKAGGAYVPLNFEHPAARIAHQLAETEAPVLVTQEPLLGRLPEFDGAILCVDRDATALHAQSDDDPERVNETGDLVYVMYTSGSTGLPKGVGVTHGNLANYTSYMIGRLGLDPAAKEATRFAVVSAISTDLGNTSVFPSLAGGGSLYLVSPETSMDGGRFGEVMRANGVDVLKITPSHLGALLASGEPAAVLPRHCLVLGGEASPWELIERIQGASGCRVLNHYGPTETTIGSCTFDLENDVSAWRPATVPVGRPIANTQVYVLDRRLEPVPVGVVGELCIGGAGVSRGYVGQPEQTAEVFVADPFASDPEVRIYRTGDRARMLPDGNVEFLGRIDQQVKIRGFRVEPAEIELVLAQHPDVRQAAVVAWEDGHGDPRLVAYLVAPAQPKQEQLQDFLRETLPDFMVPSAFGFLDALPLTPSGKVDRRSLPDPATMQVGAAVEYVAPRTELEEQVAGIWAEVLGVERVGITDDFFALGGHSLLATQVIARVRSTYAVDLPLHSLFTAPTVEGLTVAVAELQGNGKGGDDAELSGLLEELEGLSDEEAERLLASELGPGEEKA